MLRTPLSLALGIVLGAAVAATMRPPPQAAPASAADTALAALAAENRRLQRTLSDEEPPRAQAWSEESRCRGSGQRVRRLICSDDASTVHALRADGTLIAWTPGSAEARVVANALREDTLLRSADGARLAVFSAQGLVILAADDGRMLAGPVAAKPFPLPRWGGDGALRYVAQQVQMRWIPGETPASSGSAHGASVVGLALSPDGRRCATMCALGQVRIANGEGRADEVSLAGTFPSACCWTADSLAIGGEDWAIHVFAGDGRRRQTLRAHRSAITGLYACDAGRALLTIDRRGELRRWELPAGTCTAVAQLAAEDRVLDCRAGLVAVANARRLLLLSAPDLRRLASVSCAEQPAAAAISADGLRLVLAERDGSLVRLRCDGATAIEAPRMPRPLAATSQQPQPTPRTGADWF